MAVFALVEGYMEMIFLPVLLAQIGRDDLRPIIRNAGGGPSFWREAARYNQASARATVLGLADLEQAACASALMKDKLAHKGYGFHLRLARRMLESWLMADRHSLADFLRVPVSLIPAYPDVEQHPKRKLVDIARRSNKRAIREAMVPDDSGAMVGPDYVGTMNDYIQSRWQASSARGVSPSLERACVRWAAI